MVQYQGGTQGCPFHLSGGVNKEEWEWEVCEPNPFGVSIVEKYTYAVKDPDLSSIEFDFYGAGTKFVSSKFIDLCNSMGVKFREVPLGIILNGEKIAGKEYFIFLPAEHETIMDLAASDFSEELDLESEGIMMNKFFPAFPIYRKINKFIPKTEASPHLFRCVELMDLVCSREFMEKVQEWNLRGLQFVPIDETYKFDSWGGMEW